MIPDRFRPVLDELSPLTERFAAAGHRLYLVGGTVRHLLVADDRFDFDFDATTYARPPDQGLPRRLGRCRVGARLEVRDDRRQRTAASTNHHASRRAYSDDSRNRMSISPTRSRPTCASRFHDHSMALELTSPTPTWSTVWGRRRSGDANVANAAGARVSSARSASHASRGAVHRRYQMSRLPNWSPLSPRCVPA